jgi:hypothetical protein
VLLAVVVVVLSLERVGVVVDEVEGEGEEEGEEFT